jgi:outer membrane protein assembly factor BamB
MAVVAAGCNWSQYGGDAGHSGAAVGETILSPATVGSLRMRWSQPLGGPVATISPTVVNGVVYAGAADATEQTEAGSGHLRAFDAASGSLLWTYDTPLVPPFAPGDHSALGATPAVGGSMIYVAGSDSVARAIDLSNRNVVWSAQAPPAAPGPVLDGSTLVLPTLEGTRPSVLALDSQTGATIWQDQGYCEVCGDVSTEPAVAGGLVITTLVVGTGDSLVALDEASGSAVWAAPLDANVTVTAAAGTVFAAGHSSLSAYDLATGSRRWTRTIDDRDGSGPSVDADRLIIASTAGLSAYDTSTGSPLWSTSLPADETSKPAIANGVIYEGGSDGHLYALDEATGTALASIVTTGPINSSPAIANGVVYVTSQDGTLMAFGPPTISQTD